VTSPANLEAAAYAYRELLVRFGISPPRAEGGWREQVQKLIADALAKDLTTFGKFTSVHRQPIRETLNRFRSSNDNSIRGLRDPRPSRVSRIGADDRLLQCSHPPYGTAQLFCRHDGGAKDEHPHPPYPEAAVPRRPTGRVSTS